METDIIVIGFLWSEAQQCLRYLLFIGDGGSLVIIKQVQAWVDATDDEGLKYTNHCYGDNPISFL